VKKFWLSAIICTHNPRPEYLRRVLAGLREQTVPFEQWELLLIDNASDRVLAKEWDLSWHPNARHIHEPELGVTVARQRGMREASADLLVFVDDDNVLGQGYLAEALRIGREWPQLGVWGASIVPEFEAEPPAHLRRFVRHLALREVEEPRWSNVATCEDAEPWGAGMCMRAMVGAAYCRHYAQTQIRLTSRRGASLMCGEDTEICYVACSIGLGMGLFPTLILTHLIPQERVTEEYLIRLIEGMGISHFLLDYSWRGKIPRSPLTGIELLRSIKNVVTRRRFDRRLYLSHVRAVFRARSIIADASTQVV
jgi:glycosyltransferase involved in cell wall biosynthesis